MSVVSKQSEKWRLEGNDHFHSSKKEGLAPAVKKVRLQKALVCYNKAIQAPANSDQQASALKNIALASWLIAGTFDKMVSTLDQFTYYYKEALLMYNSAIELGQQTKTAKWLSNIKSSQSECLSEAIQSVSKLPHQERIGALDTYIQQIDQKTLQCELFQEFATVLFHHSVNALEQGDYKTSLRDLKECYRPIEEMKRLGGQDPQVLSEAQVLTEDVHMHTATAESLQAIVTGDELLQRAVMDTEHPNIPLVYDVLDWYMKAIVLTKDVEVEREAVARSRAGKVFAQVLKIKYKAKQYFTSCLELADSMHPRTFGTEKWHQLAANTLMQYQQESLVEQDKRDEEEKKQYLKEYEKELNQLNELKASAGGDHPKLLITIYAAFPPKKTGHSLGHTEAKLKKMDQKGLKQVFKKACIHYHPDTQDEAKHGKGWKVFCNEIVKVFTNVYEGYKFAE